jgi:hypothetical protein
VAAGTRLETEFPKRPPAPLVKRWAARKRA